VDPGGWELAVTLQLPGSLTDSVWVVPEPAFHMLFWTKVLDPPLPVMPEYVNGPQVPLAALVTHLAPELLADGLADVGLELGDELVMVGVGETGLGVPGSGAPVLGVPALGEPVLGEAVVGEPGSGVAELDEEDGKAAVVLVAVEVLGECGAAVFMNGLQPVSGTTMADTAIANQIRFGFTSKLLYLLVI
jgi:hypothetical protein